MQRLLETDDVVCYLDPDIEVFASLDEIEPLARRHSIVLTPHTTTPMPRDGLLPSEKTIRLAGVFNLGFIAVSREAGRSSRGGRNGCGASAGSRSSRACSSTSGGSTSSRATSTTRSLADEGYNVAYWNLYEREVKLGADGYEVNGRPLRFFHYSGFDPLRPYVVEQVSGRRAAHPARGPVRRSPISVTGTRRSCSRPVISTQSSVAYRYGYTAHGRARSTTASRRVYADGAGGRRGSRHAKPSLPDPFDPRRRELFLSWLARLAGPGRRRHAVSRYLRAVYDERRDVAAHFRDLSGPAASRVPRLDARCTAARAPACCPSTCRRRSRRGAPDLAVSPSGVNLVGYLRAEDGVGAVARSAARRAAPRRIRR